MKKVFFMIVLLGLGLVACTDTNTVPQTTEEVFENYVSIILGDDENQIGFNDDQDLSLFDLIQNSNIVLEFTSSDYGPMITQIGGLEQDAFHWISFDKNGEYAMEGIDTIDYQDGDVFTFYENLSTWEQSFTSLQLQEMDDTLTFIVDGYDVVIDKSSIDSNKLFIGGQYDFTGHAVSINNNTVNFIVSNFTSVFNYITVVTGDETQLILYSPETEKTAFELINQTDIELEFLTTEFGPMITKINSIEQDDFHWVSFTVNDEFAMSGLDTLEYEDGDVIEFTEEVATWEVSLSAEITSITEMDIHLQNENQAFIVKIADLPETVQVNDLVVGFIYKLSGFVDTEASNEVIVFNPSVLDLDVIDDFTDLYELEIGDVFILEFTVTYTETSSEFGSEIYAEDINGLLSTDISGEMAYPSSTDYIFYTIPSDYTLVEGNTYIGRFIYQINQPSQIPQITLYELSINGETLEDVIKE